MLSSQQIKTLLDWCSDCNHSKKAHTWTYPFTGLESVGNCGVIIGSHVVRGKHTEKTCRCREFTPYSPLDLCEMIESKRPLDIPEDL